MENLHIKNIEKSQIDIISTNRNYLNSIFKTKKFNIRWIFKKTYSTWKPYNRTKTTIVRRHIWNI